MTGCSQQSCQDPLGCILLSREEPIELGILIPTTPLDRDLGQQIVSGVELALQFPIEIHDHPVKLIKEYTTCLAADLDEPLASLSSRSRLVGVIAPTCTAEVNFFVNRLSEAGKIILSPSFLSIPHFPGAVQFSPSITEQSKILAKEILTSLAGYRFTVLADSTQKHWLERFQASLQEEKAPVQQAILSDYPAETLVELAPTLTSNDALILILNKPDQLEISNIILADGVKMVVFTPEVFVEANPTPYGKAITRAGFSAPATALDYTLVEAYSYDAALYLIQVIESIAVDLPGGGLLIPRQSLRQAVESQQYSGIMGAYTCSKFTGCATQNLILIDLK